LKKKFKEKNLTGNRENYNEEFENNNSPNKRKVNKVIDLDSPNKNRSELGFGLGLGLFKNNDNC
jgi:hypothetical protein